MLAMLLLEPLAPAPPGGRGQGFPAPAVGLAGLAGPVEVPPVRARSATSAASSLALFTYCPSYQKRAWTVCWAVGEAGEGMVQVEDQAVRPPRWGWVSETALGTQHLLK